MLSLSFWYSCVENSILNLMLYEKNQPRGWVPCVNCWSKRFLICKLLLLIVSRGNVYGEVCKNEVCGK
jgi:hypothetical protein